MNEQPQSNTPFVAKSFDEFKNKTTITHINKLKYETVGKRKPIATSFDFQLRQVKTKNVEIISFDCLIIRRSDEMFDGYEASEGEIIFNCDQENYEVKCNKWRTDHEVKTVENETIFYFSEQVSYEIKPALLKQICDAKIIKIRISGKKTHSELDEEWCAGFQNYCRQFYNNVIDASLYPEAVAGGPPKSGCFVATAAMGSYDDPAVQVLTRFRDGILMKTPFGRRVVRSYYFLSPSVAAWMNGKKGMCLLAKWFVVLPASKIVRVFRVVRG